MENQRSNPMKFLPVMFGFFIMGFVDIIGMAINYVKKDFPTLTDAHASMLAMSCFFWFLVLSIPTGMLINKIGRKNTVLISFLIHVLAVSIPILSYSFGTILLAFAFLGIGNTLIQVALNPLMADVVNKEKLTGVLTLGQFVKAISSFLGPIIVAWGSSLVWGWTVIFPIYAVASLIAFVWLWLTTIDESASNQSVSFSDTLNLFKEKEIAFYFIGILVLVGVDVGMNTSIPKLLMERCGLQLEEAGLGNSVYFFARTVGALAGGIFLLKYAEFKFFKYSVLLALFALIALFFSSNLWFMLGCIVLFGLGYANLFAIIFSWSLKRVPSKANEVSALLIMGVSGGAVVTPLLGLASDLFHSQLAALAVLTLLWVYMLWLALKAKK